MSLVKKYQSAFALYISANVQYGGTSQLLQVLRLWLQMSCIQDILASLSHSRRKLMTLNGLSK